MFCTRQGKRIMMLHALVKKIEKTPEDPVDPNFQYAIAIVVNNLEQRTELQTWCQERQLFTNDAVGFEGLLIFPT